jgi:hypothetical protein
MGSCREAGSFPEEEYPIAATVATSFDVLCRCLTGSSWTPTPAAVMDFVSGIRSVFQVFVVHGVAKPAPDDLLQRKIVQESTALHT